MSDPNSQPFKTLSILQYLKVEVKLKAGSTWCKLLQYYYIDHPHSQVTKVTAKWSLHFKASYLKRLGYNWGIFTFTTQSILKKDLFLTYFVGIEDNNIDLLCLCGAIKF